MIRQSTHRRVKEVPEPKTSAVAMQTRVTQDGVFGEAAAVPPENSRGNIAAEMFAYVGFLGACVAVFAWSEGVALRTIVYFLVLTMLVTTAAHFFDECKIRRAKRIQPSVSYLIGCPQLHAPCDCSGV
jgi:hypothetical protein